MTKNVHTVTLMDVVTRGFLENALICVELLNCNIACVNVSFWI